MKSEQVPSFVEGLAASLAGTLAQLSGTEVKHRVEPDPSSRSQELWASAGRSDQNASRLALGVSEKTGLFLARAMMGENPGEDATYGADDQELLVEFWKQALGRASSDLKPEFGNEALEYQDSKLPDWQAAMSALLVIESEKFKLEVSLRLSMELVRWLAGSEQGVDSELGAAEPVTGPAIQNLDLLLDVPLAVTLRFGERRMPLREILQLTSGALVELDRHAEDAVDLLLDARVIARGQVVVVDGCYGLRVSEVCR